MVQKEYPDFEYEANQQKMHAQFEKKHPLFRPATLIGLFLLTVILCRPSAAAEAKDHGEQTYLSFMHRTVKPCFIPVIFNEGQFFLPLPELFTLLHIPHERGSTAGSLQGIYPATGDHWKINPVAGTASMGGKNYVLPPEDLRKGDMDLFLSSRIFEELFALTFKVDLQALSLRLKSTYALPIEEEKHRKSLHRALDRRQGGQPDYPLLYPLQRKILSGGILAYNLSASTNGVKSAGSYTLTGGLEVLGGDMRGTLNGTLPGNPFPATTHNLRWHYVFRDNALFTSFRAGQIYTTGLQNQRITGAAITNDPVRPRRCYGSLPIDGHLPPGSEVELYLHNCLIDYTTTDEQGNYRFDVPLYYGTTRLSTRSYLPSGEVITQKKRVEIPYTFLPAGVFTYHVQGGCLGKNSLPESPDTRKIIHGDLAYGLARGLTTKVGAEYQTANDKPQYYTSLSASLFQQYLVHVKWAPGVYFRSISNVTYPGSHFLRLMYTGYTGKSLCNPLHLTSEIRAETYLSLPFKKAPSGIRLSAHSQRKNSTDRYRNLRLSFHTRLGKAGIRMRLSNHIIKRKSNRFMEENLTVTGTYRFTASRTNPVLLRNLFTHAQVTWMTREQKIREAGLQISKSLKNPSRIYRQKRSKEKSGIFQEGRLFVRLGYHFSPGHLRFQTGITLDLLPIRATTRYMTGSGTGQSLQQMISGTLALDAPNNRLLATNRRHAGKSAISVKFFIDENENHICDRGEKKIFAPGALRLRESVPQRMGKDSLLRLRQLQSNRIYQATVVREALPDPGLIPAESTFSFITNPNGYKLIEIPLFRTGVIEGKVTFPENISAGGLRLFLHCPEHPSRKTLRTFSNGDFYAMDLLPGVYHLIPDPVQLDYLGVQCRPARITFELKAKAGGDYHKDLHFTLISGEKSSK